MSLLWRDSLLDQLMAAVGDRILHHSPSHFTQSHPDYEYCYTRSHPDQVRLPPDGGWQPNLCMGFAGVTQHAGFNVNYYMRKKRVMDEHDPAFICADHAPIQATGGFKRG